MYISSFVSLLAVASTTQAFQLSDITAKAAGVRRSVNEAASNLFAREDHCAVWKDISATLTEQFLGEDGQCTDAARAAIRAAFHDCFNGACDGSLILADECSNSENTGLARYCESIAPVAGENNVGTGDLIQFAAAHAIKTCPGGPTVPFKYGRKDSSHANALGVLPSGNASAPDLIGLFASKGFTNIDLAALIGAHTTAKQFTTIPAKAGEPLDSTPGKWDTTYYSETLAGKAPATLQSDKNLAQNMLTRVPFMSFAGNQQLWAVAFVSAMTKMSMIGVHDPWKLKDCTSALPGGTTKRDVKRTPSFATWKW